MSGILSPLLLALAFTATAASAQAVRYDQMILAENPVFYRTLGGSPDVSHRPSGSPWTFTRMSNGDRATVFNGSNQYLEFPSSPRYSVPQNGALTIETWIRPDVLDFPAAEGDGYVHFAGKGEPGQHEWVLRMYSQHNAANRPSRISGYAFNAEGGLGSGSYFQDPVVAGRWLHVAVVIDRENVRIYKNGELRDTTPLDQFDVVPTPGSAPLRIGTRDRRSFFKGAIAKFALYDRALSQQELRRHYMRMIIWR
jgi:hypothetical protein